MESSRPPGRERRPPRPLAALAVAAAVLASAAWTAHWPPRAAEALAAQDCSGARGAGERKMERGKEREAERRRESFPQEEPEGLFRRCLGGILGGPAAPGFPPLPDLDDAVEELCRAARRGLGQIHLSASGTYGLAQEPGGNAALPWTGSLNEDIWNALIQGY